MPHIKRRSEDQDLAGCYCNMAPDREAGAQNLGAKTPVPVWQYVVRRNHVGAGGVQLVARYV